MPKARLRRGWTVPAAAALLLACAAAGHVEVGAAAQAPRWASTPAPLTVLSRHAVSGTPSLATDIRWATQRSVYLSRALHGVEVVALSPGGKSRTLLPLPERGVLGIGLDYVESRRRDRHGNRLTWASHVRFEHGQPLAAVDVSFLLR
jgi:hypothetical protein